MQTASVFWCKMAPYKRCERVKAMYLHLGADIVVRTQDIVAILDMDNATISKITKEYLNHAQKQNRVVNVASDIPKAFVVCNSRQQSMVYLSQISPATLKKRAGFVANL